MFDELGKSARGRNAAECVVGAVSGVAFGVAASSMASDLLLVAAVLVVVLAWSKASRKFRLHRAPSVAERRFNSLFVDRRRAGQAF